jgi:hypothetical protein
VKDYYAVLGVPATATQAEILSAWRTRSAILHPDKFDAARQAAQWQQANAMFSDLRHAYETLGDAQRRTAYDRSRGPTTRSADQRTSSEQRERTPGASHRRTPPEADSRLLTMKNVAAEDLPIDGLWTLGRKSGHSNVLLRRNGPRFWRYVGLAFGSSLAWATWNAASGATFDGERFALTFAGFASGAILILRNALRLTFPRVTPLGWGSMAVAASIVVGLTLTAAVLPPPKHSDPQGTYAAAAPPPPMTAPAFAASYSGQVTSRALPNSAISLGLYFDSVSQTSTGRLAVGLRLGGSGPFVSVTRNDSLFLASVSALGDSITWVARRRGSQYLGDYFITSGQYKGQGGSWSVTHASGGRLDLAGSRTAARRSP